MPIISTSAANTNSTSGDEFDAALTYLGVMGMRLPAHERPAIQRLIQEIIRLRKDAPLAAQTGGDEGLSWVGIRSLTPRRYRPLSAA